MSENNEYISRRNKMKERAPRSSVNYDRNNELLEAASSQIDFGSLEKATSRRRFTARTKLTARDNHPDYDKLLFEKHVKKHAVSANAKQRISFNL